MEKIFFSNIFIFLIIFNNLSFLSRAKYKKKKIHFYEYSLMIFSVLIEIYNWFFVALLSASIRRSIVTNGSFLIHMLRFCAPVNRRAINQFHGSSIMLITSATGIFTISDHTLRDLFHILILLNISLSLKWWFNRIEINCFCRKHISIYVFYICILIFI